MSCAIPFLWSVRGGHPWPSENVHQSSTPCLSTLPAANILNRVRCLSTASDGECAALPWPSMPICDRLDRKLNGNDVLCWYFNPQYTLRREIYVESGWTPHLRKLFHIVLHSEQPLASVRLSRQSRSASHPTSGNDVAHLRQLPRYATSRMDLSICDMSYRLIS